ncbi:FAD-dependent oxidoreductase [Allosphingosinicella indica]|uniref:Sarcosine oxidase, monomeric form n=1 Tax=Allosphingosinicella indica TaxID=941907 RepID=A0A1X7GKD2_9SPHN|nr:FAD-dependent oxidoreductase [Allosphingosinicella indica]SMF70369.1 sarcosine oxidase, monomeric form [Allosphingosinicella indica]
MAGFTRRAALAAAGAGALATPAILRAARPGSARRIVVIGAGVFGAWTAHHLLKRGHDVLLLDAWGPSHARASSGGESRMTRAGYGADEVYSRMARDSLPEWKSLSARAGLPIFHQIGVLFFGPPTERYLTDSATVLDRLAIRHELIQTPTLRKRFPMIAFEDETLGLYEPEFGALMARRAVQTLVAEFVAAGGRYAQKAVAPPDIRGQRLDHIVTTGGERIEGDVFVFACGPWLPKLFPAMLGKRIFPTRQEIFFFAAEAGDTQYLPGSLPGWADFNGGDIYYGFPDLENRGFKIAHDAHGPPIDPDAGDRTPRAEALADVRAFMKKRFPALADRPLSEARVCQYENSANGDLLIDRHPALSDVVLVGAGSGHGFKHGPAVGAYAAALVDGTLAKPEPRFSFASKGETQARAVH